MGCLHMPALAYVHVTVNHRPHFVGLTNREMIPDYLSQFMWVQRFHFWTKITESSPV